MKGSAWPSQGFTLIEVMVALGIVAIALASGLRATATLTFNAQRQSDLLLAHVCAENALIRLRLAKQMPGVGDSNHTCEQAGRSLQVTMVVRPTPNPSFLRVDAKVSDDAAPVLNVSTVLGRH